MSLRKKRPDGRKDARPDGESRNAPPPVDLAYLFRCLFDGAPIGLGVADDKGNLITFNDSMIAPGGWNRNDFDAPRNVATLYADPDDRARVLEQLKRTGSVSRQEVRFLRRDGGSYPSLLSLTPLELGGRRFTLAVVEDLTEKKKLEELARDRDVLCRALVENVNFGISIMDARYRILLTNQRLADWTGKEADELIGLKCFGVFAGRQNPCEDCPAASGFAAQGPANRETVRPSGDGKSFPAHIRIFPLPNESGTPPNFVEMVEDVTERKRIESDLRRTAERLSEANRAKNLFTDVLSHDLSNPVAVLAGVIEMLQDDEKDPDKVEYLSAAQSSLRRLIAILDSAVELSRLESASEILREPLDLHDILAEAVEAARAPASLEGMIITAETKAGMTIHANRVIGAAFSNLLSNAVRHAASGKRAIVRSSDGGAAWRVEIVDFGPGIEESQKRAIFRGLRVIGRHGIDRAGLGLAIAWRLIELHGGTIRIEGNPEGGTIFVVELPKA